jgi:hypothetical protein
MAEVAKSAPGAAYGKRSIGKGLPLNTMRLQRDSGHSTMGKIHCFDDFVLFYRTI